MNKKIVFIKNFSNLSINQGINILVAIIATPILFQNLGEIGFGLINLSFSIFILLSIIIMILKPKLIRVGLYGAAGMGLLNLKIKLKQLKEIHHQFQF